MDLNVSNYRRKAEKKVNIVEMDFLTRTSKITRLHHVINEKTRRPMKRINMMTRRIETRQLM